METAALIAKYDRRVPRYTSYPTAPHFSADVTPDIYGGWLRALPEHASVSLYLHVPFCQALCLFCACHTTVARRQEPLLAYADTLMQEIDLLARTVGKQLTIRHIHWGGGTPTALPPAAILAVMRRLRSHFAVARDAELAVEIDPRTLAAPMVEALAEMGTTRVSLGVQDFNPVVQRAIGREQSFALTAGCVAQLRKAGIAGINLDLIYGLPYQTTDSVTETVNQAMSLAPDRAAVFGYAHVPWMKKHQSLLPEAALPGAVERFRQRSAVEETITGFGYRVTGLDHFASPEDAMAQAAAETRLRRNFQGYTTDAAPVLIGLGASSIGSLPEGYVQNHAAVPTWRDAVRAGRLPAARGIALNQDDRLRRAVIEEIMCHFGADLRAVSARHGAEATALMDAEPALRELARDGLIEWDGSTVSVTAPGRPFLRTVAAAFDTRLRAGEARHSAAV